MRRSVNKLAELAGDQQGGAIVEFALIAPLLFTLVLGVLDMGRMFYVRQGLENATQQAARYLTLNPTASNSTVTNYLQGQMVGGMGNAVSVAYATTPNCNSNPSVTCTSITASYNFTFIAGYLGLPATTLKTTSQSVQY